MAIPECSARRAALRTVGALTSALPENELIGLPVGSLTLSKPSKPLLYRLVSLATFAVVVAWLAFASYALADLVSH